MRPIRLFATPLDGSLIGDPSATAAFREAWEALPARSRPLLCFNTGRLSEDVFARIRSGELPRPDYLIAAVGTEIFDLKDGQRIAAYERRIATDWDRAKVTALAAQIPGIVPQPEAF